MEQDFGGVGAAGSMSDVPHTAGRLGVLTAVRESAGLRLPSLRVAACCIFLLLIGVVLRNVLARNDGHLVYALDDPYIHLALSEQIVHGHYGLNPGEYSSPASSILWPFLLAPFAGHAVHVYVPLLLNVGFGAIAVWLLAGFVERWAPVPPDGLSSWSLRLLIILLLAFVANLISLPFVGLEHELQVLLAIACAVGLARLWDGEQMPPWAVAAAILAPLVRYESVLLTFAVAVTLLATRRVWQGTAVLVAGTIPAACFSLFLKYIGLRPLPASVLVKMGHATSSANPFGKLYELARMTYHAILDDHTRWPVAVLSILLAAMLLRARSRTQRAILAAAIMVALGHLIAGGFNWFHRYEVYAVIFLTLVFLRALWQAEPFPNTALLLGLFYLATPYLAAALDTPPATQEIYRQQFQMRRFVADYYRKDFAVNDIGLVSFQRPQGVYVLDLFGLAWYDAAIANQTPAWLESTVGQRNIGLVMIYPQRFSSPVSWTHIGELCILPHPLVVGGRCVAFYGTSPAATAEIQAEMQQFAPTLPEGAQFIFGPTVVDQKIDSGLSSAN